jgi:hypothetical protein
MKDLRPPRDDRELIAQWGEARLVRAINGKLELLGGTRDHRKQAGDWIRVHYPQAAYVLTSDS